MKSSSAAIKRVLVVEDELVISQVCLRTLTSEGFEVDIAVNGQVARDRLRERDYDLVIIDIRTPVMDGKELYQCITEKHPNLINGVILTTGDVVDEYTQRFLGLAGRPFLPKPFTPHELKVIVRETLKQIEK